MFYRITITIDFVSNQSPLSTVKSYGVSDEQISIESVRSSLDYASEMASIEFVRSVHSVQNKTKSIEELSSDFLKKNGL
jgi:hypothetical protein